MKKLHNFGCAALFFIFTCKTKKQIFNEYLLFGEC
jgi:hypothetical protein